MKKNGIGVKAIIAVAVFCTILTCAVVCGAIPAATDSPLPLHYAALPENGLDGLSLSAGTTGNKAPTQSDTKDLPVLPPVLNCRYYTEKDFASSVLFAAYSDGQSAGLQDAEIRPSCAACEKGCAAGLQAMAKSALCTIQNNSGKTAGTSAGMDESGADVSDGPIAGGIVPHHLLAGNMIASFFKTLSQSCPETLVIVAPNHKRIGRSGINTSLLDWSTPFGRLKTDCDFIAALMHGQSGSAQPRSSDMDISLNNALMEDEHSISSLIPYIKYYMPDVKIVPILLHGSLSCGDAAELGGRLSAEAARKGGKCAIVASVDFSHYLYADVADRRDEETLNSIKAFDLQAISRMGNDNLDSPPSIIALLSAMAAEGATSADVTGHSNSSKITGGGADYTTSYFTIFFRCLARNP